MTTPPAVLAAYTRSGFTEGVHVGHAVVVAPTGVVARSWGDPEHVIFPRSSNKPAQAAAWCCNVLVHNAGLPAFGRLQDQTPAQITAALQADLIIELKIGLASGCRPRQDLVTVTVNGFDGPGHCLHKCDPVQFDQHLGQYSLAVGALGCEQLHCLQHAGGIGSE